MRGGKYPALATCYLSAESIKAEANADVRHEIVATPIGTREYMLEAEADVGVDKTVLFAKVEARAGVVIVEAPRIRLTVERAAGLAIDAKAPKRALGGVPSGAHSDGADIFVGAMEAGAIAPEEAGGQREGDVCRKARSEGVAKRHIQVARSEVVVATVQRTGAKGGSKLGVKLSGG